MFVATPLEVCEARDRKGMYPKARARVWSRDLPAWTIPTTNRKTRKSELTPLRFSRKKPPRKSCCFWGRRAISDACNSKWDSVWHISQLSLKFSRTAIVCSGNTIPGNFLKIPRRWPVLATHSQRTVVFNANYWITF